jgi:transcription initiation factor TFIIIB Brf1 subunit/transcription initiation factor TFIIB
MAQKCTAHVAMMIHRERDKCASAWLAKHSVKTKPKPKPKPKLQQLERWQIRMRAQKAERRALAKPLLKGVE